MLQQVVQHKVLIQHVFYIALLAIITSSHIANLYKTNGLACPQLPGIQSTIPVLALLWLPDGWHHTLHTSDLLFSVYCYVVYGHNYGSRTDVRFKIYSYTGMWIIKGQASKLLSTTDQFCKTVRFWDGRPFCTSTN